jgi:pimeloyl-ACP methyl ester carboxylesterase
MIVGLLLTAGFRSIGYAQQPSESPRGTFNGGVKNIVLVHGAWADGSSWSSVILLLEAQGYHVVAAQLPLTSLEDDDAVTERAIARVMTAYPGPVLLVGHSYGGVVIGDKPGNDPNVAGLVYVAAFAPDSGESALSLLGTLSTPPPISQYLVFDAAQQFVTISFQGIAAAFAQDLFKLDRVTLTATQGPAPGARVSEGVQDSFWLQGMQASIIGAHDCIKAFSETDQTEDLKRIDVPILVIHGDADQIVPIDDSGRLSATLVRNGTLKVISGAPHGLCTTHADAVNAELLTFLESWSNRWAIAKHLAQFVRIVTIALLIYVQITAVANRNL